MHENGPHACGVTNKIFSICFAAASNGFANDRRRSIEALCRGNEKLMWRTGHPGTAAGYADTTDPDVSLFQIEGIAALPNLLEAGKELGAAGSGRFRTTFAAS